MSLFVCLTLFLNLHSLFLSISVYNHVFKSSSDMEKAGDALLGCNVLPGAAGFQSGNVLNFAGQKYQGVAKLFNISFPL